MKTKIILAIIIIMLGVVLYNKYQDATRANYALVNNCTWTIQGAHDICK